MRLMLEEDLAHCNSLPEVQAQTQQTLRELTQIDGYPICYVAGPISCDGEDKIPENLARLIEARTQVMKAMAGRALVFTAPYIFTPEVYAKLRLFEIPPTEREELLRAFWGELIGSGLISGIFFIDGWPRSPGTTHERDTAEALGVPIFDLDY